MDQSLKDKLEEVYKIAAELRWHVLSGPWETLHDEQQRYMACRIERALQEMLKTLHRRQCWTWERAVKEGRA